MDMNLSKLRERVKDRQVWNVESMGSQKVGHNEMIELMNMEKSFQSIFHNDISEHGRIDS